MQNSRSKLQEVIILLREWDSLGLSQLLLVLGNELSIELNLLGLERRSGHELERWVSNELPAQPEERLLEVVVRLGRDLKVLEVFFAVEGDGAGLHFALLHVDLVSAKHDRDVLANALEITMPVGDVLVGDTRSHVEHDDTTLSLDVVTVSESTELLLASGIPNVEADRAEVGGESEGVDLHTESGDVLLLELASDMALHKRCFASSSISNEDKLERRNSGLFSHDCFVVRE